MKKLFAIALVLVLCVLNLAVCVSAAPEGVESMAIVGEGIPGVDAWKPEAPAGDMEEVENNIYVKEIAVAEPCTMTIKFAGNDKWDDTCNFGSAALTIGGEAVEMVCSGDSANIVLEVEKPCVLKFTVDLNGFADGGAATVKVEEVEGAEIPEAPETPEDPEGPETPAEDTIHVYAKVPADWTDPCCWAWNGAEQKNAFAGWPGEAMTLDGEWYVIEVPVWCDFVIINGNGGAVQTADLEIVAGKDVHVDASDPTNVTVEQEGVEPPANTDPTDPPADIEPEGTEPTETKPAEENNGKTPQKALLILLGVLAGAVILALLLSIPKKNP